jgi:GNAT superfamily N-acetyltransferase
MEQMIRKLQAADLTLILHIVNDAAEAYKGIIPKDRWKEPYMSTEEIRGEIASGVKFYGWIENDILVAVMGIQPVNDVTLIRHAYVLTGHQRRGIGEKLLRYLLNMASTSEVLVGTWDAAYWAIRFYEKHGFKLVTKKETAQLLRKYWNIPKRQIETSVVLRLKKEK